MLGCREIRRRREDLVFVEALGRREGWPAWTAGVMPLVSDIITLSNFAYKLYHRLSDVPQLNHVRNNLRILRFELDNLISERKNQSSIASAHWVEHEEMLQSVVDGVEEDVIRLNDTLEKYGVSTGNTPTCIQKTKIAWHSQKIEKLNNCLESHKNSFALLRTAMNSSALEEIRPHHRDDDDDSLDPILSADIKSPFDLDKQAEMDDEEEEEEEEEMGIKEDEIGI